MVMYGSFLWNHICNRKYVQEKLTKFQRMACKAITGAWKSTPTVALEAILNLHPLHIFIQNEAIATLDRLAKSNNNRLKNLDHTRIWIETTMKDPTLTMPTDKITPEFRFDSKFDTYIPSRNDWLNGVFPPEHGTVWYTDGSLINESAGAGLFCANPTVEISIPLGTHSSIFLAEVRAILEGAYYNIELNRTNDIIFICSDSEAALKALSSVKFTSALTLETWEALNKLALSNRVDLLWVPGHSGIIGNERADALARIGALTSPIEPMPVMGTPYSLNKLKIKKLREEAFIKH